MAGKMVVNYGTFESHAQTIAGHNQRLLDDLHEIQTFINSLSGEWESDSAIAIREKITGMETRFQAYYDVVDNYAKFLRNAAAEYKVTEATNTSNANQFI